MDYSYNNIGRSIRLPNKITCRISHKLELLRSVNLDSDDVYLYVLAQLRSRGDLLLNNHKMLVGNKQVHFVICDDIQRTQKVIEGF